MFNIYTTRLKILLKQRGTLFWTLFFPIILSFFFYVALTNAYSNELNTLPIAIVDQTSGSEEFNYFKDMMEEIEISESNKMFDITFTTLDDAKSLLDKSNVKSYIVFNDDITMYVNKSGIEQSIIKSVLESYQKVNNCITNLVILNGGSLPDTDLEVLFKNGEYVVDSEYLDASPDIVLNHFYSLIAMACLFASSYGLKEVTDIQANLSSNGLRLNIISTPKYKLILGSIMAAFTIQIISNIILIVFLNKVLGINFGDRTLLVLLTCIVSSFTAIFMGSAVGSFLKKSLEFKTGILIGITLFGSFLAGLMVVSMKYLIAEKIPFLQYINPANLITDALYSLYYYESLDRFTLNIVILMAFSVFFALITYFATRRSQYASL